MTNDLIEHNPMLKKPLLEVLAISAQQAHESRQVIEERALEVWDDAYQQSPGVCVDILVRNGALTEQLLVDGESYDGTLEDLQVDADVAEDAVAEQRIALTDTGRELIEAYAPDTTLRALIAEKPQYRDIFATILRTCDAAQGATRSNLEVAISALPQLQPDPATQRTRVYPQFFIDALESAGGIVWNGSWHTTDAGKTYLAG